MNKNKLKFTALLIPLLLIGMVACDVGVDAPHLIDDFILDDPELIGNLVNGAFGDLAFATAQATGGIYHASALLTDELIHVGSFTGFNALSQGIPRRFDTEMRTFWAQPSRARWMAENAVSRFEEMFDNPMEDQRYALAALLAGHSNRIIADFFDMYVIDGEAPLSREAGYNRALDFFTLAQSAAQTSGSSTYELAAIGGMAQVHAMLGNWDDVETLAAEVPIGFSFDQIHSRNSSREENAYRWWAHDRGETVVFGTPFAEWGTMVNAVGDVIQEGDPRVIYDFTGLPGFSLTNIPRYRQKKFDWATNVPIVKGTEMRLLQAEARLHANDIAGAIGFINEVRGHFDDPDLPSLEDLDEPDTIEEAWDILMRERGIELWLEGKRLADLRRWKESPGQEYVNLYVVRARDGDTDYFDPANEPVKHHVYQNSGGAEIPQFSLVVSDREFDANPNLEE